jgi:hypothetical protein
MMPQTLSHAECLALGMRFPANEMDNGERRFRLMAPDGSGYIRVVMPQGITGGWQNAHYHGGRMLAESEPALLAGVTELCIVQSGQVAYAEQTPLGERVLRLYGPGEHWVMRPGVAHNVFMFPGAVTHTVKYGTDVPNPEKGADWYPAPESFDVWTKSLREEYILANALRS